MQQRWTGLLALAGLAAVAFGGLMASGAAPVPQARISFQIATGSSAGTYFPVGEALADLISHPPGVVRCEGATLCGPAGLIITTRTSQGAIDNVAEVDAGNVESGIAPGEVIAAAEKGEAPFRGKARHVRILAPLFDENIYLVAATASRIKTVADLKGKRVSVSEPAAAIALRGILSAFGLGDRNIRRVADGDAAMMSDGKLDAILVLGAPSDFADLIAAGKAHLVAIDGKRRDRLLARMPALAPATIAAGSLGAQPVETVATRVYWMVRDSVPDDLALGIVRALFNPANRQALQASHPGTAAIPAAEAARDLPAPLHAGAARFFKTAYR